MGAKKRFFAIAILLLLLYTANSVKALDENTSWAIGNTNNVFGLNPDSNFLTTNPQENPNPTAIDNDNRGSAPITP